MSEQASNLTNARFMLVAGFDPDTWTLHIEGKFTLSEIPRLKRLLEIYASMAAPAPADGDASNPAAERTKADSQALNSIEQPHQTKIPTQPQGEGS